MSINKWVFERSTGKWMLGFRDPSIYNADQVNYGMADLGENAAFPDPIKERYDVVNQRNRAATAQEILESQQDEAQVKANQEFNTSKALQAVLITSLWGRLGRQPTTQEIGAERNRCIQVYKQL